MTIHPDTRIGHVHLTVADLDRSLRFYRDVLDFEVTTRYGSNAVFLSAGGYHHHLGGNVWNSRGASPPPPGSAALRHATVLLPDEAEVDRLAGVVPGAEPFPEGGVAVRDPSGNTLVLRVDPK